LVSEFLITSEKNKIMKNIINIIIIAVFSFCLFSCREDLIPKTKTATLKGIVTAKESGSPLSNVRITTSPTTESVLSDASGNFEIKNIPLGDYSLKVELDGYVAKAMGISIKNEGQINTVNVELVDDKSLNSPPSIPELITPINNAVDQPLSINFTWNSTDADTKDILKFTIILKNSNNNDVIEVSEIKEKNYTINNLKYGTTYFWQIKATDGVNDEVYSTTNKFTTSNTPLNRFHYVQNNNGKYTLVSNNLENNSLLTLYENAWRPRKNNNANLVAYLKNVSGNIHIFTSKLDGTSEFQVTKTPIAGFNAKELDFSWNQTGTELIYGNFDKLYKVNKDGTGTTLLYTAPSGEFITECDWSYDGAKIAIKTNNISGYNSNIRIIDMLGNVISNVISNNIGAIGGINFSVDGKKLVFCRDVSNFQDQNYRQLDSRIFLYEISTSTFTDLSSLSNKAVGTNDLDPRFSPNNAEIIFTNTSNDGISQKNIVKITLDYSLQYLQRTTIFTNAEMPDWQ